FSIGTGRFPVVFIEGVAAAISNAFSSWLSQMVITMSYTTNVSIVANAFADGLVWGTAASAFGGTFSWNRINGNFERVFEADICNQIKYAALTSVGRDFASCITNLIRGTENRSWADILISTAWNAGKSAITVAVINRVIDASNIYHSEQAWMQVVTGLVTNIGIGTWLDVARDYLTENIVP
ncbi:MAG: hypothetical protein LBB88_02490, partial [Planctomycetaceae bacterium]|nr:hypothetical protein [Planctomycetaceae bacterium]